MHFFDKNYFYRNHKALKGEKNKNYRGIIHNVQEFISQRVLFLGNWLECFSAMSCEKAMLLQISPLKSFTSNVVVTPALIKISRITKIFCISFSINYWSFRQLHLSKGNKSLIQQKKNCINAITMNTHNFWR